MVRETNHSLGQKQILIASEKNLTNVGSEIVWCDLLSGRLIVPYFIDGYFNQQTYVYQYSAILC